MGYFNLMYFPSDYFISIPFVLFFYLVHMKKDRNPHRPKFVPLPSHIMADGSAIDKRYDNSNHTGMQRNFTEAL